MLFCIRDSLKLEVFSGARVLAGQGGLDNEIRWVNVLEVLDETDLLQEGELLLTTAYGLESDERLQKQLIPELADRGLSGLIIQVGHYLQKIPPDMCRQADDHNFPLIQLPKNISFASVTQAINRQIINRQVELLEYAGQVNARLTGLVLEGRGLPAITETLAGITGSPVRIIDPFFHLAAAAGEENIQEEEVRRQLQTLARMGLLDTVNIEGKPLRVSNMAAHHIPDQYIIPALAGDSLLAYISILEVGGALSEPAIITVSQAAALCSLEMLKLQAVRETENRLRGDFLDELLAEKPSSPSAVKRRAIYFGYDVNKEQLILLLDIDDFQRLTYSLAGTEMQEIKRKLAEAVELVIQQTTYHAIFKYSNGLLVILLQVPPGDGRVQVIRLTERLHSRATGFLNPVTFSIGVGQTCAGLQNLRRSYQEAASALEVIRATGRKNTVLHYGDLGIYRLLTRLQDDPELASFYQNYIGPLEEYDRRHGTHLLETLRSYFEHNGSLKDVAAEIFIHRHTIKYRLSCIQEITGLDLKNTDDRLTLQVGLKILPLISR